MQKIDDEIDADGAYMMAFHREAPRPFGMTDESRAAFLRRCVAEGNPDLDAWADLPDGAVA